MLPTQYKVKTVQIICFGLRTMRLYKIYLIFGNINSTNSVSCAIGLKFTYKYFTH